MTIKISTPLFTTTAIVVLTMCSLILMQMLLEHELHFVDKLQLGFDYEVFYTASEALRAGDNPYVVQRYVTPPLPAILNVPFTFL